MKYYYTKSTTIVDSEGKTVDWSLVKPDMPVKYTYVKEGDRMVISKITLAKPVVDLRKDDDHHDYDQALTASVVSNRN